MEVYCVNPADHVFVEVDAKGPSDLLSNSLATPGAIPPFHFDDRIDQFFGRPFGTLPTDSLGGKTAAGTSAGSAFCENAAESRFLRRPPNTTRAGRISRVHSPE
jgi:hypothetical protein